MSEYVPFEIQMEIIKTLPVKSLIQLRPVSKPWKSFIDSPEFIASYGVRHTQPPRLILRYNYFPRDEKYVFVNDDDNAFNQQDFDPTVPMVTKLLDYSTVVDSSRGLLCFYGSYHHDETYMAVLWNPSIRKSIGIEVSSTLDWPGETVVGFGVCPDNNDPMIVKISCVDIDWKMENVATVSIPWQVQVFTLTSRNWTIISSNLPRESLRVTCSQVSIDRFIYWLAYDTVVSIDGKFNLWFLIVSFDMTTKEFGVIDFPDCLNHESCVIQSISKLRESLVVLEVEETVCSLWMMERGGTNSFTKLFTINAPNKSVNKILGFRKNGEPIIKTVKPYEAFPMTMIEVYDPILGRINSLEIHRNGALIFVGSYMESLLLLDQSNGFIYSNIN